MNCQNFTYIGITKLLFFLPIFKILSCCFRRLLLTNGLNSLKKYSLFSFAAYFFLFMCFNMQMSRYLLLGMKGNCRDCFRSI